jgi:hypothetical protein
VDTIIPVRGRGFSILPTERLPLLRDVTCNTARALSPTSKLYMSHLESAIEAGEDFELDVNGAGSKEALNGYY